MPLAGLWLKAVFLRTKSPVVGLSSSVLFDNDDPSAAVNRRIAIILLNKKAERQITKNASNTEASLPAEPVKDENNLKTFGGQLV